MAAKKFPDNYPVIIVNRDKVRDDNIYSALESMARAVTTLRDIIYETSNYNIDNTTLKAYAKADLPPAADNTGVLVYVTDEIGGAVPAFSDGTSWRRVTDRAIVS